MKINRISQALGSISDEIYLRAIEEFEKTSNKNDSNISTEKPRVVSEEKPRKAPIIIAFAGICAAAAIALPLVLKNVGKSQIAGSEELSGATDSVSQSGDSSTTLPFPDNIILEMDLPKSAPSELPSVKLTLKTWDKEEIKRLFLSGKEFTQENENDEPFYAGEKFYYWTTTDGIAVGMGAGKFSYNDYSELDGKYKYGTVYGFTKEDCALIDDCYATNGELAAFSSADADKRAREMINKLGITNLGKPSVISVRAEFANMVLSYMKNNADEYGGEFEATPWTENEEIYILRYPQVFENTALSMAGTTYSYTDTNGGFAIKDPGAIAVVSKEKVLSLTMLTVFSEDYEVVENIPVNCNPDEAVNILKEYLSNLVPTATTKYYKCQPVYIAFSGTSDNMTVNCKPAWEFAGYSSHEDDGEFSELMNYLYRSQKYEYIWADTGHRYIEARD